jgi:hypothetical protein
MSDDAFNGACPTYSTRECPQRNQRWKKNKKITSAEYGNDEVQEDDGGSKQKRFCQAN